MKPNNELTKEENWIMEGYHKLWQNINRIIECNFTQKFKLWKVRQWNAIIRIYN